MQFIEYTSVKLVHQVTVSLSFAGFFGRGIGLWLGAAWPTGRVAKVLPHINDSVLLLSAITLAWLMHVTPANSPWLLVKIAGLIVYVALGTIAIRPGRSLCVRKISWALALLVFGFIVSVAITRNPLGVVGLLFY